MKDLERHSSKLGVADSEVGKAFIELALVIPVVLLISFSALEYGRTLKEIQIASALSREAGNIAFRKCADFLEQTVAETNRRTRECLQQVLNDPSEGIQITAERIFPGQINVILTSLRREGAAFRVQETSGKTSNKPKSKIGDKVSPQLQKIINSGERVVVAEVFVQHSPVISSLPSILSFAPGVNYDASYY